MEDPRDEHPENEQDAQAPPKKRIKLEKDEQAHHQKQGLILSPHATTRYAVAISEEVSQNLKPQSELEFCSVARDGKDVLVGKMNDMKKMTVGEFITTKKVEFVRFLEQVLPKDKQTWAKMVKESAADEWLAIIQRRVVPDYKEPGGLDKVILHIMGLTGAAKSDLGPDVPTAEKNYQMLKKYLFAFCRLAERIMSPG